jgi:phosphoribosylformimino-5-aminoimidazole carboxamide ribotide isomerase
LFDRSIDIEAAMEVFKPDGEVQAKFI